uniref:Ig-like domain-containing protein n=1 Tax=Chelydra serpentina TaxID=8475 RepID=A0A8C3T6N9_CHESE
MLCVILGFSQSPAQVWLTSGESAQLDCHSSKVEGRIMWYKEQQGGSLQWIYQSYESAASDGKYSSNVSPAANTFSLIISNVQRDDSGVYYCGLSAFLYLQPNFGNGTRLIVTGDLCESTLRSMDEKHRKSVLMFLCLLAGMLH